MDPERSRQLLLVLLVLILSAYLTTAVVYREGVGNHTSQIPLIEHTLDPDRYNGDWTIEERTQLGSPRFAYNHLMAGISAVLGLGAALKLVYVVSFALGMAGFLAWLGGTTGDNLAALLTLGLMLQPFISWGDLGGNPLLGNLLTPSLLANGFLLVALALAVHGWREQAYIVAGVATVIHAVNGLNVTAAMTAGFAAVVLLDSGLPHTRKELRRRARNLPWQGLGIYVLIAGTGLAPIVVTNLSSGAGFQAVYVMAWLRHPHHYIPSTWPVGETIRAVGVLTLGTLIATVAPASVFRNRMTRRFTLGFGGVLLALFAAGWFFTEVLPVGLVIKLQTFHVDDFALALAWSLIARVVTLLLDEAPEYLRALPRKGVLARLSEEDIPVAVVMAVLLLGLGMYGLWSGIEAPRTRMYLFEEGDDRQRTYAWIEQETPQDAVFLVGPSEQSFQLGTGRAAVVTFKNFPFRPDAMIEWKERMDSVCGGDIADRGRGFEIQSRCQEVYRGMNGSELASVMQAYEAGWVMAYRDDLAGPLELKYSEGFAVYQLRP